jgi:predicted transcriptional regulator
MEPRYKTLQTIFNITKEDPQPTMYKCRPREIILRQFQDWSVIQQHIHLLEREGLVSTKQEETLAIQITEQGIEKIKADSILTTGN